MKLVLIHCSKTLMEYVQCASPCLKLLYLVGVSGNMETQSSEETSQKIKGRPQFKPRTESFACVLQLMLVAMMLPRLCALGRASGWSPRPAWRQQHGWDPSATLPLAQANGPGILSLPFCIHSFLLPCQDCSRRFTMGSRPFSSVRDLDESFLPPIPDLR